jgi:7-carboxy-7-deazaguanine synthase
MSVEEQLKAIRYDDHADKIPVIEIFKTLQGEGILIGTPSVFVRLAVCNLHCAWCDTKYTWVPKLLEKERIRWFNVGGLVKEVVKVAGNVRNVVFTGGEPLLWWDKGLKYVVALLGIRGFFIEVETNGTVMPVGVMDMPFLRFNVSFKLSNNKADRYEERIKPEVLKYFNDIGQTSSAFFERVTWKIVIKDRDDLDELLKIIDDVGIDKRLLVIMPEMTNPDGLGSYGWLVDWCVENGVRFIDRLHIRLWGNVRGR